MTDRPAESVRRAVTVGDDGRLVLPAELLAPLGLGPGSALVIEVRGDAILVLPAGAAHREGDSPAGAPWHQEEGGG